MWHEARRQEKQLRARLVDCSKRAERRRKYYDNVRRDPDQFMQIHGRKYVIHADKNVARTAEDANILRKWQGDDEVLIDRFDARSHLDFIPPGSSNPTMTELEKKEEMLCNFERYRLLVMNSFKDIPEKNALKHIADKEFWLSSLNEDTRRNDSDKKKKTQDGKNSIGMSYEDTEVVRGGDDADSSNDEEMGTEELDVDLEVHLYNADSQRKVNKIGEGFGVQDSHFVALFKADLQAQKNAAELRRIERQKVLVAGRDGKQERQMLKKQRAMIVGRGHCDDATTTLSSLRASATQKKIVLDEGSSSSSEEEPAQAEFITSFGGDGSDVEKKKKSSKDRRRSPDRSRRRRSRSRSRDRRHSRSRNRRSRSRSRSRSRHRKSRSRRSRSRSPRRRRTRSPSRRSSSSDKPLFGLKKTTKPAPPVVAEVVPQPSSSSESSGDEVLLKITSSMSESEKERIEIENRKRRVRRTKRLVKEQKTAKSRDHESDDDGNTERVKKVKQKMKKVLKQTVEEFKEEEEERKKEMEREKRVREELNFIEEQERRLREQHRRQDERDRERKTDSHRRRRRSSSSSDSSDDRRRRRR